MDTFQGGRKHVSFKVNPLQNIYKTTPYKNEYCTLSMKCMYRQSVCDLTIVRLSNIQCVTQFLIISDVMLLIIINNIVLDKTQRQKCFFLRLGYNLEIQLI